MRVKTAQKWFEKICSALNDCELKLQKIPRVGTKPVGGHCDGTVIAIRNRPDKENIELTLIHEALHYLYPDWTEKKVKTKSKYLLTEFTTNHLKGLRAYLRRQ